MNENPQKEIDDALKVIFDNLNIMGREKTSGQYIVDFVRKQHRTLQQNFFGQVIIPLIMDFAKRYDDKQYDPRNEASCKAAKEMEKVSKGTYFPFI
jgi:hypothetical protein